MRSYKLNYSGVMNYLIYRLQFNIRSYDNIQICGWQSECSADAGGSVRNVRGGLSGIDSVAYILFDCTKFNRLRQDILWQGTGARNMTKILGTPNHVNAQPILWLVQDSLASLEWHA